MTVRQPVVSQGTRYGTLLVFVSTADLRSRIDDYLLNLALLGIGALVAAGALAWALERMVTRRLLTLVDVTRQVARSGDYSLRAMDRRHDEIGLLASAFNNMLVDLQHRQDEAHEAIRLRDEFLSIASHELKTPLTSLKLRVQGMLEHMPAIADPLDAARIHKSVDLAERQVRRLEKLVNNLLDVSRIAVGRFPLQREQVDLSGSCTTSWASSPPSSARSGNEVSLDAAPSTPTAGGIRCASSRWS